VENVSRDNFDYDSADEWQGEQGDDEARRIGKPIDDSNDRQQRPWWFSHGEALSLDTRNGVGLCKVGVIGGQRCSRKRGEPYLARPVCPKYRQP
jgi:hypothetical protein